MYVYYNHKYVRLELVYHSELGLCCYAHWATRTYPDSIIFTIEERYDDRYQFRFGHGPATKLLEKLVKEKRMYFATNDVGSFFEAYYNRCTNVGVF